MPINRTISCDDLDFYLIDHLEDKEQKKKYDKIKPFQIYVADFDKYITNNQSFIVNYAERYRYGEVVSIMLPKNWTGRIT